MLITCISALSQIVIFDLPLEGNVYSFVQKLENKGIIIEDEFDKAEFNDNEGWFHGNAEFLGKIVTIGIHYTPGTKKIYDLYFLDYNYVGRNDIEKNVESAKKRYSKIAAVFNKKYGTSLRLKDTKSNEDNRKWNIKKQQTTIGYVTMSRYDKTGFGKAVIQISFKYNDAYDPRNDF